jgi:phage-related protein
MTITMTGPLVNPKLENKTNDIWLQYLGTLVTGESLVIKTADYSVTKADQNMIPAFRHGGDASWFILEPGANELELTTDGAGGSITIAYKPAYY